MEDHPDNEQETERQAQPAEPKGPANDELEEAAEAGPEKGIVATFRAAFDRARHRRRGLKARVKSNLSVGDRTARNRDRTRTLFVSVVGLVAVLVIFLGVFSSSRSTTKREPAAKRNPSLGRPEDPGRQAGSVTPLLNAETNGPEAATGQLTADDINSTSRPRVAGDSAASDQVAQTGRFAPGPRAAGPNAGQTLNDVPFTDPALESYRQRMTGPTAVAQPTAPPATPPPPAPPATSESDLLGKASLVYVRANVSSDLAMANGAQLLPTAATTEPVFLDRKPWNGLPAGTRLLARLETAASTAVKAPVVAVIETHYERDGEIVLPAGTKVFGELESGTHSGYVGIRFHTLRMPNGSTEKIEANALALDFGPLKGQVTGRNRGKQFLAHAVTGVGTVAAFAVGHPGGLTGSMDNSILLRDRISQNIGMAGEQEVMNLAYAQEIVVTVPGNTRFFIVLQEGTGQEGMKPELLPAGSRSGGNLAVASSGGQRELPSASELRELVLLKQELNRMYREVAGTRTMMPIGPTPPTQAPAESQR